MAETYRRTFTFRSEAAPPDAFEVVRFSGEEGLSRPYLFDITLLAARRDLDPTALVQSPAVLTLGLDQGELPFHGIPALFEMQNAYQNHVFYRVVLAPRLWWLTLTRHNQIFLDQTIQGFVTKALVDGGLTEGKDFELRLTKSYPSRDYVCQYRESHFDFISRWMERDGLYYFFEQTPQGEKMVITDARTTHGAMPGADTLLYLPPSGLDWPLGEQSIKRFSRTRHQVPKRVTVTDYNYRKPDTRPKGQGTVSATGVGERHMYGQHALTEEEAGRLATVRAEELACRETLYEGLSSVPHVRSGYLFKLEGHFRDALNTAYLTVEAHHQGGQEAYLSQVLGVDIADAPDTPYYRNTFTAIDALTQYRAEQKTEKPKFYGVLSAKIDASQSGQYAELDDQGRYKVILPFDLSGRENGKASSWLRMVQPYGGADHGLHFPLHKGTEVLLMFVDGDPDRPVIQAAVPNPEHKSLVTSANSTKCMLTSGGGNKVHIENQAGSERILMQSPTSNSWSRLGQPNDPASQRADDMLGWKLNTSDTMLVRAGLCNKVVIGTVEWEYFGNNTQMVAGEALECYGLKQICGLSKSSEINFWTMILRARATKASGSNVALNDECIKMAGELAKLRADATELETLRNDLEPKRAKLESDAQEIEQTKNALELEVQQLTAQRDQLSQEVEELNATNTRLTQSEQQLTEAKTTLLAQKSTLNQQKTYMTANNLQAADQVDRLTAMRTELGEMSSALVGFRSVE